MSKVIHYYNCFIKVNGRRTTINLSTFLDRVFLVDENTKFRVLKIGEMSLPEMVIPDPNNANTYQNRSVGFAKYRDRKPYAGTKRTDQADLITTDVLEMTNVISIPTSFTLLIEYNHYGARPSHIQSYLNTFLPNDRNNGEDVWEVELIAIEPERGIDDVLNSRDIKYIEFKLNLQMPLQVVRNPQDEPTLFQELLEVTAQAHESFGANVATICFGNGRYRQEQIVAQDLIELIRTLDLDSESFESIKVKYLSPSTGKVESIDLKHAGILKRTIMIDDDNDGWEYILQCMSDDYYNNERPGNDRYIRHSNNLLASDIPPLRVAQEFNLH